jgi:hypothetical protein
MGITGACQYAQKVLQDALAQDPVLGPLGIRNYFDDLPFGAETEDTMYITTLPLTLVLEGRSQLQESWWLQSLLIRKCQQRQGSGSTTLLRSAS